MNEQNIFQYLRKASLKVSEAAPKYPGAGSPTNSSWGCAAPFFKSWPDFRPKNVIFYTRFQTGPLKSIPTKTKDVSVRLRTSQNKIQGRTPQPFCTEQLKQNSSEVTPVERPVGRQAGRAG